MAKENAKYRRVRFMVPLQDDAVLSWLNAQGNMSYSIRRLIQEYVAVYGATDVTCRPIGMGVAQGGSPVVESAVDSQPIVPSGVQGVVQPQVMLSDVQQQQQPMAFSVPQAPVVSQPVQVPVEVLSPQVQQPVSDVGSQASSSIMKQFFD